MPKGERNKPGDRNPNMAEVPLLLKDRALAAAAEGITIADIRQPDQPLIYANDGFERLTLYPVREIAGTNCRFLQGPDTDPGTVEEIRKAIQDRRECTVEILNYRKDGKPFWNRLSLTPVVDHMGETTHYIGVQSDVSARRYAEDALRKANHDLETANQQMKRDLQAAARIQQSLLPRKLPKTDRFHFSWLYEPSEELGGDTLNVIDLGDGQIALYTLDVSGHGVSASLLSVTLSHWLSPTSERSVLVEPVANGLSELKSVTPAKVAETLNRQFPMDLDTAQYFTLLYAKLETNTAELSYVSAGSPPIVHAPKSQPPHFEFVAGYPIGIVAEPGYEERKILMAPGDRLYFYTDGVPDAMNSNGDDFGMERLAGSIGDFGHLSLNQSLSAIIARVRDWAGDSDLHDDATILGVEYLES